MKDIELKLVSELMKNSRRSDRELAKAIGTSQPTVSRAISRLEKEGVIKEYTMIPDFAMLGYEIIALTFISINTKLGPQEADKTRKTALQLMMKESPDNIIMLERGVGLKHTGTFISFHKNYSDYTQFIQRFKRASATHAYVHENVESFLIDLKDELHYRPLTLQVLANDILRMNKQNE
jgi:DNA-binding Lrp family transcriptional regulator